MAWKNRQEIRDLAGNLGAWSGPHLGGAWFYGQPLIFPNNIQICIKTLNFKSIVSFCVFGVVILGSLRSRAGVVDVWVLRK